MKKNPSVESKLYLLQDPFISSGLSGYIIWLIETKGLKDKEDRNTIERLLKIIFFQIQQPQFKNPGIIVGLSGILWLCQKLRMFNLNYVSNLETYIIRYLKKNITQFLTSPYRSEFLYGVSGFLAILTLYEFKQEKKQILNYLENNSFETKYGSSPIFIEDTKNIYKPDNLLSNKINTGIAHGISGIILATIYHYEFTKNQQALDISQNYLSTLKNCLNNLNTKFVPSKFPSSEEPKSHGWCYGNPGIAWTLFECGRILKISEYIQQGQTLLIDSIDYLKDKTLYPHLCHGQAFLELLQLQIKNQYNEVYQNLPRLETTVEITEEINFLYGVIGIELVEKRNNQDSLLNWESLLLMSSPYK